MNIYHAFAGAADQFATAQALVFGRQSWSYTQLAAEVERCALALAPEALQPGERVVMLVANRPEFVFTFLALQRWGVVVVPIDTRLQSAEIEHVLRDCEPRLVLCEPALVDTLKQSGAKTWGVRVREVPASGSSAQPSQDDAAAHALPAQVPRVPDDVAVILYTSGTTGAPKGACITHRNLLSIDALQRAHLELTSRDRVLTSLPLSHVAGLVCGVLTPLLAGASLRVLERFKAAEFLAAAQEHAMTYTLMVPTMYQLCLMQPDFERYDLTHWRVGHYGAAPMPAATIELLSQRLAQLRLVSGYGSTELTASAIMMPLAPEQQRLTALGKALSGIELRVVDPVSLQPVADGQEGELWVRSPGLIPCYWRNEQATTEGIVDGFWRSGDIVRIDADGYVYIMDRLKDMINRGGYKVFPAQVESVLSQCPGVLEAAVIGRADPVLGERVHAFIQCQSADVTAAQLQAFCAQHLADYAVPETFSLSLQPLPRNATGKLAKRDLRQALPRA